MKAQFSPVFALFAALATTSPSPAKTILVPDDQGTIQEAIAAAGDGDRIVVAAGTYRERIALKPGVSLVSAGDDSEGELGLLRAERTIIDGGGAGEGAGVLMAERSSIDGFTVTKVGQYDNALWQKHWGERGENQDHAHIGGFRSPGIGANGVSCLVRNCIVHHNGHTGIALRGGDDSTHPLVCNNTCFRNMGGGIGLMGGVGGIVRNNRCFENFYAGIGHSDGAAPLVVENECHGNIRAGIGVSERSCPVVRSNRCYANRRAGIGIRTGAETRPVVEDNHCYENGMAGIGSEEEAQPILRNNRCERNAMAGIGAREGAKPLIVGNQCRENGMAGIGLRQGCEAIVWGNTCEANKLVAIGLPEGARAILVDNKLSREGGVPPLVAIKGGSEAIVVGNTLRGGGVAGILLEGKAMLAENDLGGEAGKSGNGIWLWKGSRAIAAENLIQGYKKGVNVSEGADWVGSDHEQK